MAPTAVLVVVFVAVIGWMATLFAVKSARISTSLRKVLFIISWIPWISMALGAPVMSGYISLNDALNMAGAMTAGIVVSLLMARRRTA